MADFSEGFGVDGGSGMGPVPLHHASHCPPPRDGEERGQFGRGWIPASRDIGIPGEGAASTFREREGDGPRFFPSDLPETDLPHTAWDADRRVRFLHHLADKGDVRAACGRVGMSRTSAYLLRRRDAAFARAWQAALVQARRHVEEVLATRALDGVQEAVWFRGELVGTRRRYDSRLLLAHLARLDHMAGEDGAGEGGAEADRFNEMLALVAGERADEALRDAGAAADALPLAREDYLNASVEPAYIDANEAWIDTVEGMDTAFEEAHGFSPDDEEECAAHPSVEAPDYPPVPTREGVRAVHAARWDDWQSRACARVDRALFGPASGEAPMEFKSLEGLPGKGRAVAALDRVNRVNLPRPVDGGARFGKSLVESGAVSGTLWQARCYRV